MSDGIDETEQPRKLKYREIAVVREQLHSEDPVCSLCEREITEDPCLDHCHDTGHVRNVLCRVCNSMLGKIENAAKRVGKGVNPITFIANCLEYVQQDYSHMPIHAKHGAKKRKKRRPK